MSLFCASVVVSACDTYPRDIEGTRDRVVETGRLRVGYGQMSPGQRALADRFVERVAKNNGARLAERREGSNEALFAALDKDRLDLVIAEVAADSPWLTEVAVIEPLARRRVGDRELGLSPVVRNGENRWVMQLESEVRADAGPS